MITSRDGCVLLIESEEFKNVATVSLPQNPYQQIGTMYGAVSTQGSGHVCLALCPTSSDVKPFCDSEDVSQTFVLGRNFPWNPSSERVP